MWDLVSENSQMNGHNVVKGPGTDIRDVPKGNKLTLICQRGLFTKKQLQEFQQAAENPERFDDDDFEEGSLNKRKRTDNDFRRIQNTEETKSFFQFKVWL